MSFFSYKAKAMELRFKRTHCTKTGIGSPLAKAASVCCVVLCCVVVTVVKVETKRPGSEQVPTWSQSPLGDAIGSDCYDSANEHDVFSLQKRLGICFCLEYCTLVIPSPQSHSGFVPFFQSLAPTCCSKST